MTLGTYNDTSTVIRMTIVSDTTTWSITYNHHSDDSRDVIYDCNIFLNQATDYSAILVVVVTVDVE
jgi:hypothetical protein